jgi:GGDEF domain-containing protein
MVLRDISERKLSEERLEQLAHYDSLTGLPNRKLFSDRLGRSIIQARRNHQRVGLLFLDVDFFKDVNDTLGHEVGTSSSSSWRLGSRSAFGTRTPWPGSAGTSSP